MMQEEDKLKKDLLDSCQTIAVLGLSDNPKRPSNMIARYLMEKGYKIVPLNPEIEESLGQKAYQDLMEVPFAVDLLSVFRREHDLQEIIRQVKEKSVKGIWIQPGIACPEDIIKAAADHDIPLIRDACIKVAHRRLAK